MLHVFVNDGGLLRWAREATDEAAPLPEAAVWLDLINPTADELAQAEALIGASLPTREQMAEIEESSRLRVTGGTLTMTVTALVWADTDEPRIATVSFVLAGRRLVTIHDIDPQALLAFRRRATHGQVAASRGELVLAALVDGMVDRTSAVLRRTGVELDVLNRRFFRGRKLRSRGETLDDSQTLKRIGHAGHLIGKARVSLASLTRMTDFLARGDGWNSGKATRRWAKTTLQDLRGLDQYARFLAGKVALALDTALGQINVEQNEIVKIVSVLTVLLFPPTLVASIGGMNFSDMPGSDSPFGYPSTLLLMVLSALLPMIYVRLKRWM
ncbi:magnesium transporter [Azospirillum thiophilum]|uniref:Magnesium transporter n=1 Tax=Azospirillum thiophilum TaxID=528244 RepID=A0AAC8VV41_9PROT|nr:magnesium transporter CorA family protein [Azospirillum thiophilum]ALG69857.1 magnesium transporter [Azospirillum thiophilum]KJR66460.1 magnesium transporter [Azospirillum thiophilum]